MSKLLIVDDEPNVLYSFGKGLSGESVEVLTAETGTAAVRLVEDERPDAMILDVRLPDVSGLDVFDRVRAIDPRLPVIVVTAHSTTDTAIDAMKRGAFEYLLKPVDLHELRDLVTKALELSRFRHVPAVFDDAADDAPGDRIVGRSPAMQEVYKTIGRVAREDVTVLVLGESGTGKELVARAIYHHSRRADRPFQAINCAALSETLLESELFGHERGAFTGADRLHVGKFEQADGGTLFLDEVGDMSPATQAKVLRVLQDGRFERVGGSRTIETDVRVIAATNQNLDEKIDAREFRHDLLYRLNGFTIRLPPLRERPDDLPLLIEHFLRAARHEVGKQAASVAPDALRRLENYDWPGNVRELQSVVQFAVLHAVGEIITADCLPESCRGDGAGESLPASKMTTEESTAVERFVRRLAEADEPDLYRKLLAEVDGIAVREVLKQVRGNQVHASQRLGMSRTTLRAKLSNLGLDDHDLGKT